MADLNKNNPDVGASSDAVAASAAVKKEGARFWKEPRVVVTRATLDDLRRSGILSDGDTDSMISVSSGGSRMSFRDRPMRDSSVDSDDVSPAPSPSPSLGKRARGRPPTTGEYVGLAKAKAELNAAKAEELRLQAERELAVEMLAKRRRVAAEYSKTPEAAEGLPDLQGRAGDYIDNIIYVASTSKNLKGGHIKTLKEAAKGLKETFEELRARSITEEMARLEADNKRLSRELAEVRREMAALRAQPPAQAPLQGTALEELTRVIVSQCGAMINARMEALEERLPPAPRARPPLAADKAKAKAPATAAPVAVAGPSRAPASAAPAPPVTRAKRKKAVSQPQADSQPPPSQPDSEGWSVVGKKRPGKKRAKAGKQPVARPQATSQPAATPKPQTQSRKKKTPRLRVPRTAAVVLTLTPDAIEKGVSYEQVILSARQKIDLAELGIGAGMRYRASITGARVFEIPKAAGVEAADNLAARIEAEVGANVVRVSRPEKCVDMRISGLDESSTKEEVVAAVARAGDCKPEAIRAGNSIRHAGRRGTLWLRCPIAAAKKVAAGPGKIVVGWVAARAEILEARKLHCFRCLEAGHVGVACSSKVDRSGFCFRCGKPGHKAASCSEEPNCPLCEEAGKPARHRLGAKTCSSSPPKRDSKSGRLWPKANPHPTASGVSEEGGMETS